MSGFSEHEAEEAALTWLESTGWSVAHGMDIAPDKVRAELKSICGAVLLEERLVGRVLNSIHVFSPTTWMTRYAD